MAWLPWAYRAWCGMWADDGIALVLLIVFAAVVALAIVDLIDRRPLA